MYNIFSFFFRCYKLLTRNYIFIRVVEHSVSVVRETNIVYVQRDVNGVVKVTAARSVCYALELFMMETLSCRLDGRSYFYFSRRSSNIVQTNLYFILNLFIFNLP